MDGRNVKFVPIHATIWVPDVNLYLLDSFRVYRAFRVAWAWTAANLEIIRYSFKDRGRVTRPLCRPPNGKWIWPFDRKGLLVKKLCEKDRGGIVSPISWNRFSSSMASFLPRYSSVTFNVPMALWGQKVTSPLLVSWLWMGTDRKKNLTSFESHHTREDVSHNGDMLWKFRCIQM